LESTDGAAVAEELATECDALVVDSLRVPGGWDFGRDLRRGEVHVARVLWGGRNRVHVSAQGAGTPRVAEVVRDRWKHGVSRVDVCLDWDEPGVWDEVSGQLEKVSLLHGIKRSQMGDWITPHRSPGEGRTLYAGSEKSAVRVRCYEKGRQLPEAGRPDWVRAEQQTRPNSSSKVRFASLTPSEVWGAADWTADLFERLTGELVPAARVVTWHEPDGVRARAWMLRQYGKTLASMAREYDHDPARFGGALLDELRALGLVPGRLD